MGPHSEDLRATINIGNKAAGITIHEKPLADALKGHVFNNRTCFQRIIRSIAEYEWDRLL